MKQVLKNIIPFTLLAAASLSCSKNELNSSAGYEISFGISLADILKSKAAGQFTAGNINDLGTFKVTGYDGSDKVIDNREVHRSKNVWKLDDNPRVWLEGHTMTFHAGANMPSWASYSSSSSTTSSFTVTSIPTSVNDQWDPLVGYYSGTGTDGRADIKFYHALTAVSFQTGDKGTPAIVTGISGIKLTGVYNGGTAAVSASGSSLAFSWTGSGSTSVSGSFNDEGTKSQKPFLLIPQSMTLTDKVSVEITVKLAAGGTQTMNADIISGSWLPGYSYNYILDVDPNMSSFSVTLESWEQLSGHFEANFE